MEDGQLGLPHPASLLYYLGFGHGLPVRYPIFLFFLRREAEGARARAPSNCHTLEDQRRNEASFLLIIPVLEPRAPLGAHGCCSADTQCGSVHRVVYPEWWYTQGVQGGV